MKNENFKLNRDKIDGEMSEMFAFDPTCSEKAVHDAMKEKMRAEAVRKNRSTRNRLIVSTAASLAVVVTAVTLLPALFSDKNVDNDLGNGFAPGTNMCYSSEKTGVTEIIDFVDIIEEPTDGETVKYFKFLSAEYDKQLDNNSVLIVYKDNEIKICDENDVAQMFYLRSYVKAESERNDLSYDGSDMFTYCPVEEPVEETMISTEATSQERVEETIAAVEEDTYATESIFFCELPAEDDDTTYVTSSGNSSVPMEKDVADVVIIYPDGDSIAVWSSDTLIDERRNDYLGKFLYFDIGSRYDPNNYYYEPKMVEIFVTDTFFLDIAVDFECVSKILLKDAIYVPTDTSEISTDTTPTEDITYYDDWNIGNPYPETGFDLILNGNPHEEYTSVHTEIDNMTSYLSEMYAASVGIYGESIFKIGFEYDPEMIEYMGITAVDFDENFVVVSSTEFELQSHSEEYCATYDIPEINAGFGRAYFISVKINGEEESILFIDGEVTSNELF